MLLSLKVENFALIDNLELELHSGLNILTGETGAGKSIILDALDAALGGKVSSRWLRTGTSRATVEATFADISAKLAHWLKEQEIEALEDGLVVCSREITARSNRTRLNGVVVNKQQIQALREQLVEITAQGQAVLLGRESQQRDWLDSFGGSQLLQQRQQVAQLHEIKERSHQRLLERQNSDRTRLQQIDMLQYQLQELDTAQLDAPDELEQLEQERNRLAYSVELQQQSYEIYEQLYHSEAGQACADLLGKAESILTDMVTVDPSLENILELVSGALAQVEEASRQINTYGDNLESDPEQLEIIEDRIRQLKQICRKYGPTLPEAIAYEQKMRQELESLTSNEQSITELEKIAAADLAALTKVCIKLTQMRQVTARELEQRLITALKSLAMEKVLFRVAITPITPTAAGADQITFEFSPNPGEPLQPLSETASGGEVSRFLLALKTCLAQKEAPPHPSSHTARLIAQSNSAHAEAPHLIATLVFDEIDVGVSGRVSQAIARQLFLLSRNHQVLCVTHQPIVAAIADYHYHVSKQVIAEKASNQNSSGERTTVKVQLLNPEQRKQELAQLAGGVNITDPKNLASSNSKANVAKNRSAKKTRAKDDPQDRELEIAATEAIAFAESLLHQADNLKKLVEQ